MNKKIYETINVKNINKQDYNLKNIYIESITQKDKKNILTFE